MSQSTLCQLLSEWGKLEPQRCRQRNPQSFEVIYQGDWYSVADYPGSHGMLMAAILDSCQKRKLCCSIHYLSQSSELDDLAQLQISCSPDRVTQHQADNLVTQIPTFLLEEYLTALQQEQMASQYL
ncbi:hypothetical protein [Roseofilum casamattae]|uniref:Uncharacterized protein n=1 Tax=Roseofilum casamattae BLCC-M143 TaxID=3022442 RepID=A0ABT7BYE2_9CYAN|nr:hypothetical protein [Roseofilum casamattae]MDJ1184214.1 hypothetical protein [Roseofilum casamattae BLCC-M143]